MQTLHQNIAWFNTVDHEFMQWSILQKKYLNNFIFYYLFWFKIYLFVYSPPISGTKKVPSGLPRVRPCGSQILLHSGVG